MKNLVFEDLKQAHLSQLSSNECIFIDGGDYYPGAGPGGIGPVLSKEQVLHAAHQIGDFFRGVWNGFNNAF